MWQPRRASADVMLENFFVFAAYLTLNIKMSKYNVINNAKLSISQKVRNFASKTES